MSLLPVAFAAFALGGTGGESEPSDPWRVERIEHRCTLFRQEDGARPVLLTLDTTPGSGLIRLIVADPGWSEQAAAEAAGMSFLLDPGGPVAGERARPIRNPAGAGVELTGIDQSFLAAFAAAGSIRLQGNGKTPLRLKLADASAAVRALRDCEEQGLRHWGVDTAARSALVRLPKPAGAGAIEWFRWQEYPKEAIRARASGTVVTRVTVGPTGRATNCTIVVGAGHPALDKRTCESILKRARFDPALDAAGKAVRSDYIARTVWRTE